jgi:hypothetical protein
MHQRRRLGIIQNSIKGLYGGQFQDFSSFS